MKKTYTVNQLAQMAGISVRALHHYDEIGLLKPAFTGENRYRYYGEDELLRLQQILIHRELDIPLAEIGAILDAPGFDKLETLRRQRARLEAEAKRYAGMVRTIDRTIARLKGDGAMKDADLYANVISPEKQAEYEQWLIDRYGPDMERQIERSRKRAAELKKEDWAEAMQEFDQVVEPIAEAFRRGVPPQARSLDPAIARHRDWVSWAWDNEASPQAYAGLADVYDHPDFAARFNKMGDGFAAYLTSAMRSWAKRQAE